MKFVLLIYNDPEKIEALPQAEFNETMRGCLEHADELRGRGRLLDTQMLADASTAKSVRVRKDRRTVLDGPFAETKELLAGFNLIEADSMEEAVRIAESFPWVRTGCVEVRPVVDIGAVRDQVGAGRSPAA